MKIRSLILAAGLALSCTSGSEIDQIIDDLREQRAQAKTEIIELLKDKAEQEDTEESELEQQIQEQYDIEIYGSSTTKTEERLELIKDRLDHYATIFEETPLETIYMLEEVDEFSWYNDIAGRMSDREMILYEYNKTIIDHETTHARQDENREERQKTLAHILKEAGERFRNEHYNPDQRSLWKDLSISPKGYFITAYSNTNIDEYEAEVYEQVARLLRGQSSAFTNINRELTRWPKILKTLKGPILPEDYVTLMIEYTTDEKFSEAIDLMRSTNTDIEAPLKLNFILRNKEAFQKAARLCRENRKLALTLAGMEQENLLYTITQMYVQDEEEIEAQIEIDQMLHERTASVEEKIEFLAETGLMQTGYVDKINNMASRYCFYANVVMINPLITDVEYMEEYPTLIENRQSLPTLIANYSNMRKLLEYKASRGIDEKLETEICLWSAEGEEAALEHRLDQLEERLQEDGHNILHDYYQGLSRSATPIAYYQLTQTEKLPAILEEMTGENYSAHLPIIERKIEESKQELMERADWQERFTHTIMSSRSQYDKIYLKLVEDGMIEQDESLMEEIQEYYTFNEESYIRARQYALRVESLSPELKTEDTMKLLKELGLVILP